MITTMYTIALQYKISFLWNCSIALNLFFFFSPALRTKLGTPSNSERLQMLSPAAKKLMAKTGTPVVAAGSRSIRASYTPSQSPRVSNTPGINKMVKSRTTTPLHTAVTPNISLTDDLLKLKK